VQAGAGAAGEDDAFAGHGGQSGWVFRRAWPFRHSGQCARRR
jgi:hypothetical protein